ncbi:S8 family serine peptidase [Halocatena salina]|uniref:S8 family serine peptidase n=1 Tax=Halocatena salina TaxID=2934340 RepID=A0A8T9ZZ24_9EURY|nr:S8 family serine peptidase [Halocatena salina]UPM41964.1 S8 family serine peptidase [Halocatena salina]
MSQREMAVVGVIVLLLWTSFVFPLSYSSLAVDRTTESSTDVIDNLKHQINRQSYQPPPTVDEEVEVAIPIDTGATPNVHSENYSGSFVVDRRSTKNGQQYVHGSMAMSDVRPFLNATRANRIRITNTNTSGDGRIASGVSEISADRLHERGLTGENVTVGIIDSDFRPSHPAIASQVGGYATIDPDGDGKHGTAVASVVVDTAPNATLQLAAVGTTTTSEEYADAVEWLQRSGADIIIDAGSYYAHPENETSELTRIAEGAASDTVFVTSVGNHAGRYWSGNRSSDTWVSFQGDSQMNPLNDGKPLSGTVQLTLRWDGWPRTTEDYDLYLFRAQPGTDAVVAQATGHDGRPFEHLETTVPEGRYYVSIRSKSDTVTTNQLELFANHELRYRSHGGQAAPATASGVIAVGAIDDESVKSFSARGANVVAPDLVAIDGITVEDGTSFSTPYVAGASALVLASNPGATPTDVRTALFLTAEDVEANGIDDQSGYGMINATRAVDYRNSDSRSQRTDPPNSTR